MGILKDLSKLLKEILVFAGLVSVLVLGITELVKVVMK